MQNVMRWSIASSGCIDTSKSAALRGYVSLLGLGTFMAFHSLTKKSNCILVFKPK